MLLLCIVTAVYVLNKKVLRSSSCCSIISCVLLLLYDSLFTLNLMHVTQFLLRSHVYQVVLVLHVFTNVHQSSSNSISSRLLLLRYVRVMLLAAGCCTAVPLCILLALRARVRLAADCRSDPYATNHHYSSTICRFFLCMPACVTSWGPPHSSKGRLVLIRIFVEFFVCFRSYIFVRAPFQHTLRRSTEEGHPDTVVEVWARSAPCVTRGVRSKLFFGGSG